MYLGWPTLVYRCAVTVVPMVRCELPRLAALSLCVGLLFALFVAGGASWPADPREGPGIDTSAAFENPEANAGQYVETSGVVVETDPVVLELEYGGTTEHLEIENAPAVEKGQQLFVDGTLTEEGTLDVNRERAVSREPGAHTYRNVISLVGALLVTAIGIDSWRLNLWTISVEPRERPLHETFRGGERGDSGRGESNGETLERDRHG